MSPSSHPFRPMPRPLASGVGLFAGVARAVAFWSAVLFPLVYASGYLAVTLDPGLSLPSMRVLAAIIGANLLAVLLGHDYEGTSPRGTAESTGPRETGPTGD